MRITYLPLDERLEQEFVQASDEGKPIEAARWAWRSFLDGSPSEAQKQDQAAGLLDALAAVPAPDAAEPSTLEEIRAARREAPPARQAVPPEILYDRILGGWLGRAAGCLLGKPVEKATREGIRALLESSGQWPLRQYITAEGIPDDLLEAYPWNKYGGVESLRENLVWVPEDDDLNYTMLNLHVLEAHGADVTPDAVLHAWLDRLPVLATFTAERVAYLNALHLLAPPATATHRNPYREWIGAQIRADVWGWASPGDPEQAAALAWRDASVSHTRNGIYGAMFVAAALAASFTATHPVEAVEAGLGQIPARCRLAEAVRFGLGLPAEAATWEEAVDRLYDRYGRYHWVHTLNNTALLSAALAFGDGDFEASVCNAVMGGWDTDSHGATVGALVGTWLGADRLPASWTAPLQRGVRTSLKGFDRSSFDDLARRTVAQTIRST